MTPEVAARARLHPRLAPPRRACDCHVHVFDIAAAPAATSVKPIPNGADADALAVLQKGLGMDRAILVQPSHYGLDNEVQMTCVSDAPSRRAVVALPPDAPDALIESLHERGARGARLFLAPGATLRAADLPALADRVGPFGWCVELQVEGRTLPRIAPLPAARTTPLGAPLVITHMGRFRPPASPRDAAFDHLLRLVDRGAWVKLSAPYVGSIAGPPAYADSAVAARALIAHAPERMVWGSNWPHTNPADPPPEAHLLNLLADWTEDDRDLYDRILADNPAELYGLAS